MSKRLDRHLQIFVASAVVLAVACSSGEENKVPNQTPVVQAVLATEVDPEALLIAYTQDGYNPKRLNISLGQKVHFVNQSEVPLWPASNIHPTHEIYPEFDAKQVINPQEVWVFKFDELGFWRYHNHLKPEHGALIVVQGDATALGTPEPLPLVDEGLVFPDPPSLSTTEFVNLFKDNEYLVKMTEKHGPAHLVHLLKEAENHIDVDCHQRAHAVGNAAYRAFGAAAFALASHECQAGAFHGATEGLFADRGTINLEADVRAICSSAQNNFFRHQCVHGVGHGLMAWTTYEIHDALPLCDRLETDDDKQSCYSGVYMENVVGGLSGLMGHTTQYLSDDPHFPCNVVATEYYAPCYFYQTSHMIRVFNRDFEKVAIACEETSRLAQAYCFQSYGRDVGNATRGAPAQAIDLCSYAPQGIDRINCIRGAAQDRFWEESSANEALSLCHMLVDVFEKGGCYEIIINRAKDLFPSEHGFETFCAQVEKRWAVWCKR